MTQDENQSADAEEDHQDSHEACCQEAGQEELSSRLPRDDQHGIRIDR